MEAVPPPGNSRPSDLEVSARENLILSALDSGLSYLSAYTTTGVALLREKGDRRSGVPNTEHVYDTPFLAFENGNLDWNKIGIYEVAVLTPCTKDVEATRTVVDKSGILGIGRKTHEEKYIAKTIPLTVSDATGGLRKGEEASVALYYCATDRGKDRTKDTEMPAFRDAFDRPGNGLYVKIILPESVGKAVSEEMVRNPRFIRSLVDAFVRGKYEQSFIAESWDKYAKPPYEVWDARPVGERKFYFADLVKNPQDKRLPMSQVAQRAISY